MAAFVVSYINVEGMSEICTRGEIVEPEIGDKPKLDDGKLYEVVGVYDGPDGPPFGIDRPSTIARVKEVGDGVIKITPSWVTRRRRV